MAERPGLQGQVTPIDDYAKSPYIKSALIRTLMLEVRDNYI